MQHPFKGSLGIDFYKNQSIVKWLILVVAAIIGFGSIIYTKRLVDDLEDRERVSLNIWARAVEYASTTPEGPVLDFLYDNIITPDNVLPIIIIDSASNERVTHENVISSKNDGLWSDSRKQNKLASSLKKMKVENAPIRLKFLNAEKDRVESVQYIYYRNSFLLRQLSAYPYIQLTVIAFFGVIAYLAFSFSKKSEQNKLWVGLAKETAHQLGTPLSSLMAWVEYLKGMPEMEGRNDITDELQKDVYRLEMITSRFSNIGSAPALKNENVFDAVFNIIEYLKPRVSSKVEINIQADAKDLMAMMNRPLFEWVIENITKNGIDAMSGIGKVDINIGSDSKKAVFIDIRDNGKGIPKSKWTAVFKPGYTTKQRGWGLGLALVQRIIENYHFGRIFVKSSQVDVGTTFRIILTTETESKS
jgi:signal transduction histidine kinase